MAVCGWLGKESHSEHCPWPEGDVLRCIDWLCLHGSSLDMNFDADADWHHGGGWEVSWISSGLRWSSTMGSLSRALQMVYERGVLGLHR